MTDAVTKLAHQESQRHALSLPNLLTYGRLVAVPLVAGLILWGGDVARWTALAFFIGAAITDFFDGYLARRWAQQSAIGQDLMDFADALRLQRFGVAGYDWGGRAACIAAALHPDRVRAAVG